MASNGELRRQVLSLYKNLLSMGREYPKGYTFFRDKAHKAFLKNKYVSNTEEIQRLLGLGNYVLNELTSLYDIRRFRAMKHRYYLNQIRPFDVSPSTKQSPNSKTNPTDGKTPPN